MVVNYNDGLTARFGMVMVYGVLQTAPHRNQAKKSRAMFPFTFVKRSGWSDHTHIIVTTPIIRSRCQKVGHDLYNKNSQ